MRTPSYTNGTDISAFSAPSASAGTRKWYTRYIITKEEYEAVKAAQKRISIRDRTDCSKRLRSVMKAGRVNFSVRKERKTAEI